MELALRLAFQVLLLIASGFFSGSETALFSMSRLDLQKLRTTRHPRSETIHALLDEPRRLIISILCGNELVNIASAANMAAILVTLYGADASWINILVMVPLLLLVGEVTPKTFAVTFPLKYSANLSARLLPLWVTLISPLRVAVRFVSDRITTLVVGAAVERENILHADEFRTLVAEGAETGVIDATERVLIDNMIEAAATEIIHIMTPRTRIDFLDLERPFPEIVDRFRRLRHPRAPVFRGQPDNILGMLHSEDVLRLIHNDKDLSTVRGEDLLRPAHFVPPTKKVDEMFDYFQTHNTRAAIVLGEYGGVVGIVTMKDVLLFIFGEISGTARGQELYQEEDDNRYVVPGDMRLTDFDNLTNFGLEDPMMTTIGGVAFRAFDRLPKVGDVTVLEGVYFRVHAREGLRIKSLEVSLVPFEEDPALGASEPSGAPAEPTVGPAPDPAVSTPPAERDEPQTPDVAADEAAKEPPPRAVDGPPTAPEDPEAQPVAADAPDETARERGL